MGPPISDVAVSRDACARCEVVTTETYEMAMVDGKIKCICKCTGGLGSRY